MSFPENKSFLDIQVNALNDVFETLNKDSRKYCILRNFNRLPFHIGNDIDFLISKHQKIVITKTIISIMLKHGFEVSNKIERYGHLGLYFHHSILRRTLIIDLLTRCMKIWYEYADVEYILNNVSKFKNFFVPQNGAILYTVAVKDLLTYGEIRQKNQALINNITMDDKDSFIRSGRPYFSTKKLEKLFRDLIQKEVTITKRKLFYRLQFKIKLYNVINYFYFRLKEKII
jgi:hypothetical protein